MKKFKTTDIVLASTLKLKGYKLESIEIKKQKGIFIFLDVDDQFIEKFNLDQILISPIDFNNMIKTLTTSVRRMI